MSQDVPSSLPTGRIPLPRSKRTPHRPARPRFSGIDLVWLLALPLVFLVLGLLHTGLSALHHGGFWIGAASCAGLYLLGRQIRDRATAVTAGFLLATSLSYLALSTQSLLAPAFALLTMMALAAWASGSLPLALALAAGAVAVHYDGGLLLILLPGFYYLNKQTEGGRGALFLLGALALIGLCLTLVSLFQGHLSRGFLALLWFLIPFGAEMAEPPRASRWHACFLWTFLFLGMESLFPFSGLFHARLALAIAEPFLLLFAATGVSRLIPAMVSEIPTPAIRHILATVAVVLLCAIRLLLDLRG